MKPLKIYTAVYRPFSLPYSWFGRDSGLVTEGLRSIDVASKLVILQSPGMPADERFLPATSKQFCDPVFWRSLNLDAVILQGGAEAATQPVADAIRESQTMLLYRMDTDGVVDPVVDPFLYLYGKWWTAGNPLRVRYIWWEEMAWENARKMRADQPPRPPSMNSTLPHEIAALSRRLLGRPFTSIGMVMAKLLFPDRFGGTRFVARLAKADAILAESKIASARLRRLAVVCNRNDIAQRVHTLPIPIPVAGNLMPTQERNNVIITAGRLYDDQKDARKFVEVVNMFLTIRPDYRAVAIGDGNSYVEHLVKKHARSVADRITIIGRSSPETVRDLECMSKIFLCTSRGESMHIASAEAACAGCSIVGPSEIASMQEYAAWESGTLAWTRRTNDFVDAVMAEANEWDCGRRDPRAISSHFSNRLSPVTHARQLVEIVENISHRQIT